VLIDPMNEDMTIHIHNHIEAFRPAVLLIRRTLGNLGLARLMDSDPGQAQRGYTQQEWNTLVTLKRQLKSRVAAGMEPPLWICGELARAGGSFGDIPVVVLSAGIQDQEEDPKLDNDQLLKFELHRKLAGLSTQGAQVIVRNSGHDIPEEAPEVVARAVRETVREAQQKRPAGLIGGK
jgi:hypothetical protein